MFYNLNIAFRNLRRNGLYSLINVAGLAVGLTAVILIMLWVWDELNYDSFYHRSDDIYLVTARVEMGDAVNSWRSTPTALAHVAREQIPGVDNACTVNPNYDLGYLEYEGQRFFGDRYITVGVTFFDIFTTTFIEGSAVNPLPDPYSVVLTESLARKIFGNEPAVGKALIGGNGQGMEDDTYYVSGVISDHPKNSVLKYDAVFSFERSRHKNTWANWSWYNFFLLNPAASKEEVTGRLLELQQQNYSQLSVKSFDLQKIQAMRLYGPSGEETGMASVRLFSAIAVALLLIACINYVNLTTARSNKRNKEMAIRKVMGSGRGQLAGQLLLETGLLCLAALFTALLLVVLVLPFYNQLTGKSFAHVPDDPAVWMICLVAFVVSLAASGIYPAVKLSSFNPIGIFRAPAAGKRSLWSLRKILVVLQFISVSGLIVTAIVLNRQLHYIQHKQMGYDREQVFTIDVFKNFDIQQHYESFRTELEQEPSIAGVTGSRGSITWAGQKENIVWPGMPDGAQLTATFWGVNRNLLEVLNIPLIEGTGFTNTEADRSYCFLNETAVKAMQMDDPLGKTITVPINDYTVTVAGVVKDFNFEPLDFAISPLIIQYTSWAPSTIYVKCRPGMIKEALAATEQVWKKHSPYFPLTYAFLDDTINDMYRSEQQRGRLFNYFSLIAVLISCLGLFGLVTYTAETKTKEIGVRKVLGAGVGDIVALLSREFLLLVGIAMLIAFPLAYYWLGSMLQNFVYRVSISWWMFALAALLILVLTLLTVGWKAWRAATANPVDAIKTE